MAAGAEILERRAVLLWLKSKLPKKYQNYVELQGAAAAESNRQYKGSKKKKGTDFSKFEKRQAMQNAATKDNTLPKGLRDLLIDDELWALYKPTGHEIKLLRDLFVLLAGVRNLLIAKLCAWFESLRIRSNTVAQRMPWLGCR